jgi:hypothetical protein
MPAQISNVRILGPQWIVPGQTDSPIPGSPGPVGDEHRHEWNNTTYIIVNLYWSDHI